MLEALNAKVGLECVAGTDRTAARAEVGSRSNDTAMKNATRTAVRVAFFSGPLAGLQAHGLQALRRYQNWFIVLCLPDAFSAASPLKYSLWSSPMSEPDMFWCLTQAMPWRISLRWTPAT